MQPHALRFFALGHLSELLQISALCLLVSENHFDFSDFDFSDFNDFDDDINDEFNDFSDFDFNNDFNQ